MTYTEAVQYIKDRAASVTSLSRCFEIFEDQIEDSLRTGDMDYETFALIAVTETAKVLEQPKRLYWIREPDMDDIVCPLCEYEESVERTNVRALMGAQFQEVVTISLPSKIVYQLEQAHLQALEWQRIQFYQAEKARRFRLNKARIRATF